MKNQQQYGTQENDRLIEKDRQLRAKIETKLGEKFTDEEWFSYKVARLWKGKKVE